MLSRLSYKILTICTNIQSLVSFFYFIIFYKEMYTFIQQGCIKLIKSDSKYNNSTDFNVFLLHFQQITENEI